MTVRLVVPIAVGLAALGWWLSISIVGTPGTPAATPPPRSLAGILRDVPDSGFARALGPVAFRFPADHGAHPQYRSEWWYVSGNLEDADRHHFGFQLTFFRSAVTPEAPGRDSAWATNQAYMAHFAISDGAGRRFYHGERFSRGALGLAGASAAPFRVWLDDWSMHGTSDDFRCRGCLTFTVSAGTEETALELSLRSIKPVVLQGDRGFSRKSEEPGNASFYYSLTRLQSSGTLRIGARTYEVSGYSWLDREWSTSMLGANQQGWDWFALQLFDGTEVMFYQMRRRDGGVDSTSSGTIVDVAGVTTNLRSQDVQINVDDYWRSPGSGVRYPSRWQFSVPQHGIDVVVEPVLAEQEFNRTFRYWEGAVWARRGEETVGFGYVELTGYQ